MEEALETRGKTLSEDECKFLEELYQPREIQGHG